MKSHSVERIACPSEGRVLTFCGLQCLLNQWGHCAVPCMQSPVMEHALSPWPTSLLNNGTAMTTKERLHFRQRFSSAPLAGSGLRGLSEQWLSWWSRENSPHTEATRVGLSIPYMAIKHYFEKCHFKIVRDWSFGEGNLCSFILSTNITEHLLCAWLSPGTGDKAVNEADKSSSRMELTFLIGRSSKQNK